MIAPVSQSALTAGQHQTAVSIVPKSKEEAGLLKQTAALKANDLELLTRYTGKLASLLIASQDSSNNTLLKLALSLARVLALQQRDGESSADFSKRLVDVILAMKPADRTDAEAKSGLKALHISAKALAEALKNPGSALAARLVVLAEAPLLADNHQTSELASQSYNLDDNGEHPVHDSLKYRAAASQAAILSPKLEVHAEKQVSASVARHDDLKQVQSQLSRVYLTEDQEPALAAISVPIEADELKQSGAGKPEVRISVQAQGASAPVVHAGATKQEPVASAPAPQKSDELALEKPHQDAAVFSKQDVSQQATILTAAGDLVMTDGHSGLIAAVAERIARAAGLAPKMSAQVLSETILKAATDIITEEKTALKAMASQVAAVVDTADEPPLQTSRILKDLSKETIGKLQLLAEALTSQSDLDAVLAKMAPKAHHVAESQPMPERDTEINAENTDLPESQFKAARIAASEIRQAPADLQAAQLLSSGLLPEDADKTPQMRQVLPETAVLAPELLVQKLLTADILGLPTVPYPFAKDETAQFDVEEEEAGNRREDGEHDNDNAPDDSNREPKQQRNATAEPADDNPFAPEAELKRHPSDAERAFHMYQKMGGFCHPQ